MIIKLLTEPHLEFLSIKGGCTGLSESTLVKMPHCWKSHVSAHIFKPPFPKCLQLLSILRWCFCYCWFIFFCYLYHLLFYYIHTTYKDQYKARKTARTRNRYNQVQHKLLYISLVRVSRHILTKIRELTFT